MAAIFLGGLLYICFFNINDEITKAVSLIGFILCLGVYSILDRIDDLKKTINNRVPRPS